MNIARCPVIVMIVSAVTGSRSITPPAISRLSTPTLSGSPEVGKTITCAPGTYSGAHTPLVVTHQWYADNVPIAGAVGTTYISGSPMLGKTLKCIETVRDSLNNTLTYTTNSIGPISVGGNVATWVAVLLNDI